MVAEYWLGWSWRYHWWPALPVSSFTFWHLISTDKFIRLTYTRAILDAIHSGELAKVEFENYDTFNLAVPKSCPGVPAEMLNPQKAWAQGDTSFKKEVSKLGDLFVQNFKKYESEATEDVINAAPMIST